MYKQFFYGLLARIINLFIPTYNKHWVFGADYGQMYREGSKYMIEYIRKNNLNIHYVFVTRNINVYNELRNNGINCVMNDSIKGIVEIAKGDAIFTCQYTTDILYVYRKIGRTFYYLVHGQPYKKVFDLSKQKEKKISLPTRFKKNIYHKLILGYDIHETDFISSTSDYLAPFMSEWFSDRIPVKVLGSPRIDGLFDDEYMKQAKWIPQTSGKYVVTYMPTHRLFGKGDACPIPFLNDPVKQEWLKAHNILLLVKQHPNMIPKIKCDIDNGVILDISKFRLDPMVVVYNTDLLITDYSSVWMDYLVLKRPLLFYFYDNFEENDTDVFFDVKNIANKYCCYDENELFEKLIQITKNPDNNKPDEKLINKFHKYTDGDSCKRVINEIMQTKYYHKQYAPNE